MPVNEMFLKEQFVTAKKYHEKLRELIKFEFHEFESDFNLRLIGERIFEILTQTMLDICTHIVAHSDQSPPNSYFECMKILGKIRSTR